MVIGPLSNTKPPWSGLQLCTGTVTMVVWCLSNSLYPGLSLGTVDTEPSVAAPCWTHEQIH